MCPFEVDRFAWLNITMRFGSDRAKCAMHFGPDRNACHTGGHNFSKDLAGGRLNIKTLSELDYFLCFSDGTGKFVFYLRMYTDAYYSALISEYPFQIKPRDYVYFEAYASVSDKKLVVLIDQCYTTPTMQRDDPGKKVFIEGG